MKKRNNCMVQHKTETVLVYYNAEDKNIIESGIFYDITAEDVKREEVFGKRFGLIQEFRENGICQAVQHDNNIYIFSVVLTHQNRDRISKENQIAGA